jgi:hypothetical protein
MNKNRTSLSRAEPKHILTHACRSKTGPGTTKGRETQPVINTFNVPLYPWPAEPKQARKQKYLFFAKTKSFSLFSSRQNFYHFFMGNSFQFFFCGFGCKIKFGENNVIPDPDSRLSHEPLKLTIKAQAPRMLALAPRFSQDPTFMGSGRGKSLLK